MKVIFISGCGGDTQRYRVFNQMEQLRANGCEVEEYDFTDYEIYHKLNFCDYIIMHRVPYIKYIDFIISKMHRLGKKVFFDIDDIVFDEKYAKYSDGINHLNEEEKKLYFEGIERYKNTLIRCDGAIVSTEFLEMAVKKINTNVIINRNALSDELICISEKINKADRLENNNIKIGYFSGTKTHNKDFEVITDALYEVMKKHENVQLIIGGPLDISNRLTEFNSRIMHKELVPWRQLPEIIKSVDINLAPLEIDNPFCKAKSELKYIEAAILKVPTVASKIDAFEIAIKHGENGLLASNKDEWIQCLELLINNKEIYSEISTNAYNDAISKYTPKYRGQQLINSVNDLLTSNNNKQKQVEALTINFLIPQPFKGSGGHTTILRMVKGLVKSGHTVNVYVQGGNNFPVKNDGDLMKFIENNFFVTNARYFIDNGKFKDSDVFIATSWPTAYIVNQVQNVKKKMYFVQDFEPYFYPMSSEYKLSEISYRLNLSGITIGRWLTEVLQENYNMDSDYIDFGVDTQKYNSNIRDNSKTQSKKTKIIFYARASTPRRGFEIATQALERVFNLYKDKVEILLFGGENLEKYNLQFEYTDLGILKEEHLNELYNQADIALVMSLTNCSLLPLEIMATKCVVVDIDSDTVKGILENEKDCLLSRADSYSISESIIRLINDVNLRNNLVDNAHKRVIDYSWDKSVEQFENIVVSKFIDNNYGSIIRSFRQNFYNQVGAPILNISNACVVTQKIKCNSNNLHRFDIFVGTYGLKCKGSLVCNVKKELNDMVPMYTIKKDLTSLKDNEWLDIEFPPIINSENKEYYFEMYTYEDQVALYGSKSEYASMFINNVPNNSSASIRVYYKFEDQFKYGYLEDNRSETALQIDELNYSFNNEDEYTTIINNLISKKRNNEDLLISRINMVQDQVDKLNTEIILFKHSILYRLYNKVKKMHILKPIKKKLRKQC